MKLTIEQALQKGVTAHKEGKLREAERFYRAILEFQPFHADANHNLGVLAISDNKADEALTLFEVALQANPSVEQFWLSYIDALIKEKKFEVAKQVLAKGREQGVNGQKLGALEAQLSVISQQKNSTIASPLQNQLDNLLHYYQTGRYVDAEELALSLTQEFPEDQFGWKVLGAIFQQAGRNPEALSANQKAVELAPQDVAALSNLGVTFQELSRFDEAEVVLRQAIALKPDFAEAYYNLGNTLRGLSRLEEAEASLDQAIALKPDFADAHNNLGNTLKELGRLKEAEASLRKAIALISDFAKAHSGLGITLQAQGRLEEAEASLMQAKALEPDYAEAHNNLGVTLQELGRLEEAEASYKEAIELKSDFAEAHTNLGNTFKELGRFDEAEASLRQAIALKPDFDKARLNLGILLYEGRQYNSAVEQFDLIDLQESKIYSIRCSYMQDAESIFFQKLESLISQGELNAVIGSLICCAEIKYKTKKLNPFCNKPLAYILKTQLSERYDFTNIFIKTAREILADNSVSYKSQGHLTNGIQTSGNFFAMKRVYVTEIENIIRAEIENYRLTFEGCQEGFIRKWPASYDIFGWLVSMQSGGNLKPHMHDTGWITGSIYINVPAKSKSNDGNLVLRMGDQKDFLQADKSQESIVNVVTGSLCLFPSSLLHHTIPFAEEENRIVLAFDVIPKKR
jgi:Flp pilus assembly protein TadD